MSPITLCSVFLIAVATVESRPGGPPVVVEVCRDLMPNSMAPHMQQQGSYGYDVDTNLPLNETVNMYRYTAGGQYNVTITGNTFRGFLMQARNPAGDAIGTFQTQASTQQILDCSGVVANIGNMATIAHTNGDLAELNPQTFNWTAPAGADGYVTFMYTLVPRRAEYYGPLSAPPPRPTAPNRTPDQYPFSLRWPLNCVPSSTCEVFAGMARNEANDRYLDVYLEATSESWIAAGFSETNDMYSADVVVCVYDTMTSMVVALDTYNAARPLRNNMVDTEQNVMLFSSSRTNTTIQCTLAKRIKAADAQDLNLNADLWGIYARGGMGSAQGIMGHMSGNLNRGVSPTRFNPATVIAMTAAPASQGAIKFSASAFLISFLAAAIMIVVKV